MLTYPQSDVMLSRRLERCEANTNAAFVEARARVQPESGAGWIECNGTYAMFDGVSSPLTQTFGFGLFSPPSDADLDLLEDFIGSRGAPVFHEVSPLAPPETLELFARRGYHPVETTSILYRPIVAITPTTGVQTRIIEPGEEKLWASTSAEGWREYPELGAFMLDLARVVAESRDTRPFLAEIDGRPVATGALSIHDGIAILAGASTIPEFRNRGAQRALLEARLAYAAQHGCELAMMGAQPGSGSQRNAERQGFRIAYTRIKWGLAASSS